VPKVLKPGYAALPGSLSGALAPLLLKGFFLCGKWRYKGEKYAFARVCPTSNTGFGPGVLCHAGAKAAGCFFAFWKNGEGNSGKRYLQKTAL